MSLSCSFVFAETSNSGNDHYDPITKLLDSGIAQIGVITAAVFGALFKWQKDRKTPSSQEQEKMFNELFLEMHFEKYYPEWKKLWNEILLAKTEDESQKVIEKQWEQLGKKEFPDLGMDEKGNKVQIKKEEDIWKEVETDALEKARHLHLDSITKINQRKKMDYLKNISRVRYQEKINQLLPQYVSIAVKSSMDSSTLIQNCNVKKWENESLKNLERLLTFAFLKEDVYILRILIMSEINRILLEYSKKQN